MAERATQRSPPSTLTPNGGSTKRTRSNYKRPLPESYESPARAATIHQTRRIMANPGFTIWFTGLSGAGKSTLSEAIAQRLQQHGRNVEILDGDVVRTHLSKGLGFSREDRDTNIKRIAFVCSLLTRNGVINISAAIAPYREARAWARQEIGNFVEIYVKCSLDVCRQRDVKGLYKLVDEGKIKNFTGVDDPYEEPEQPELVVETDKETLDESLARIFAKLVELEYLGPEFLLAPDRQAVL
ncbi:MAG TPA: adenylyl-sulfate kinase [Ktedonobacteraceae bacterium]|nr:adenylyl-sulfate kinase [Ktedonobacteraceae bacterium]